MKHRISNRVICPFYHCEERQVLYCEGLRENTAIHLAFAFAPELKAYRAKHCETAYTDCPIAKMLAERWSECSSE